jgi:glucan phosphoethanolaminetransferase (alkaline phosphatase superfamily)
MGNNNSTPITIIAILGFICLAVWWIESRFGATMTGFVLVGIGIALAIVIGFVLNMVSTKNVMGNLAEFNKYDAQTDRFRMMSHKEFAKGEAAERAAQAKISVIDARRIDQIAQQRTKALLDVERQKWQGQQRPAQVEDDWWTTEPSESEWE